MEVSPVEMGPSHHMGMPMEGTIVDDAMMAAPTAPAFDQDAIIESASPAPTEAVEQPEQPFEAAPAIEPPVPTETEPPVPAETEPAATEPSEPASEPEPEEAFESSDDDLFGGPSNEPPAEEMPAEEPATEMPADDLFGGSDDPIPAQPNDMADGASDEMDDLFGGPETDAPAETESSTDDLFGDPPADDSSGAMDDLFGGPASDAPAEAESSTDDLFGDPPAADSSDEMDDLFGTPPAEGKDAAPGTDEQPSIDDLFGDAGSQNESIVSEETSVEDLFGSPESSDEADFDIDDLFSKASMPTDEAITAVEELPSPHEQVVENSVEAAVQVVSKKVMPTDGLVDTRSRTWIDNTGTFHVEGRLIEIAGDHIRLLKANGRTCTVPNSRLSQADAAYVDSIREQADSSRLAMLTSK